MSTPDFQMLEKFETRIAFAFRHSGNKLVAFFGIFKIYFEFISFIYVFWPYFGCINDLKDTTIYS